MSPGPDGLAELQFEVGPQHLASAVGSGDVPVLATPTLIAWLEAATMAAATGLLDAGETTVGTRVDIEHVAAIGAGATVSVWARVVGNEGRVLHFDCGATAPADSGRTLAAGRITRAVVDRARFASRWG